MPSLVNLISKDANVVLYLPVYPLHVFHSSNCLLGNVQQCITDNVHYNIGFESVYADERAYDNCPEWQLPNQYFHHRLGSDMWVSI